MKKTLLLGCGYFGEHYKKLKSSHKNIVWTSRNKKNGLMFSFENKASWASLPSVDETIISFPIIDKNILIDFLNLNKIKLGQLLIIGSTGQIIPDEGIAKETSARDLSQPRANCEEHVRSVGGILMSSSGIYGPEKSPLDWVRNNYVGRSEKYLNLIHVHDLVQIVEQALLVGKKYSHYIASDGSPEKWNNIIDYSIQKKWLKGPILKKQSNKRNKKVDPSWTLSALNIKLQYPNVFVGLNSLH